MSVSDFRKHFGGKLDNSIKAIIESEYKTQRANARAKLNSNTHVMHITESIIKRNLGVDDEDAKYYFKIIKKAIRDRANKLASNDPTLIDQKIHSARTGETFYTHYGKGYLVYATNYNNIQKMLGDISKNTPELKKTKFGPRVKGKDIVSGLDVGHTAAFGRDDAGTAAGSAIYNTLLAMQDKVPLDVIKKTQNFFNKKFEGIHSEYKVRFDKKVFNDLIDAKIKFVYTVPQHHRINQQILGKQEQALADKFLHYLYKGRGSKPLDTMIDDNLTSVFMKGKRTNQKSSATFSNKIKAKPKGKKPKVIPHSASGIRLRNSKGQFTSTLKIKELLQPLVTAAVRGNMDSASYFKTRSDRFTKSVKIEDVQQSKASVIVKYNYMKYPYEVFEPGRSHHKPGRDPTSIIEGSIRAAATKVIGRKFNILPQQGRGF
ncbi:MAG: hypothetical protein GY707_05165 [Desulfobacteraceae bacterium]|nr:hypothetical protein [Desulfobacteraceae bacterium]